MPSPTDWWRLALAMTCTLLMGACSGVGGDAEQGAPGQPGRLAPPQAQPDPSEELALQALLKSLDPDRREAFVLTQLLGLTYEEAAQVCGCPVGTIRSRVARARTKLITSLRTAESQDA